MNIFQMNILQKYIEPIKTGQKCREYRLNNKKRQQLKLGDMIVLKHSDDHFVQVVVTNIRTYKNWENALKTHWQADFSYLNLPFEAVLEELKTYYSQQDVDAYGIVVFDIKPI